MKKSYKFKEGEIKLKRRRYTKTRKDDYFIYIKVRDIEYVIDLQSESSTNKLILKSVDSNLKRGLRRYSVYIDYSPTTNCQIYSLGSFSGMIDWIKNLKIPNKYKYILFEWLLLAYQKNMVLMDIYARHADFVKKAIKASKNIEKTKFFNYTNTRGTKICFLILNIKK